MGWLVLGALVCFCVVIFIDNHSKYSPVQEEARAHLIASFGKEGGMIFHTLMVLIGETKESREKEAEKILYAFKLGRDYGMDITRTHMAELLDFHKKNINQMNRHQWVAVKWCYENNIYEILFTDKAA